MVGELVARIPAARRPSPPAVDFIRCHQKPEVFKAGGDAGNCSAACRRVLPYGQCPEYEEQGSPVWDSGILPLQGVREPAELAKRQNARAKPRLCCPLCVMGPLWRCLQKRSLDFLSLPWAGYPETAPTGAGFAVFLCGKLGPAQAGDCDVPFKPSPHKTYPKSPEVNRNAALVPWGVCRGKTRLQEAPGLCGNAPTPIPGWG